MCFVPVDLGRAVLVDAGPAGFVEATPAGAVEADALVVGEALAEAVEDVVAAGSGVVAGGAVIEGAALEGVVTAAEPAPLAFEAGVPGTTGGVGQRATVMRPATAIANARTAHRRPVEGRFPAEVHEACVVGDPKPGGTEGASLLLVVGGGVGALKFPDELIREEAGALGTPPAGVITGGASA